MPARSQVAYISPPVLQWARKRAGLSLDTLAAKAHVRVDRIAAWEHGKELPTLRQAEHIAGALHVPFGYFFLPTPPDEEVPLPDFRVVAGRKFRAPSVELLDTINDVSLKQQWYRDYVSEEGRGRLPVVGRFKPSDDPREVARDIRAALGLAAVERDSNTPDDFLRNFIRAAESVGILVMKSGIVGSNPHRKLNAQEFRGFTISDDLAPVVFVNGVDSRAAQVFTLAHELAHVWIDRSGISNEKMDAPTLADDSDVEALCNQSAAETLVPATELTWNTAADLDVALAQLTRRFRVSRLVILRRLRDLGFINAETFFSKYREVEAQYKQREKEQDAEGGGNFFPTLFIRNSRRFTETVISSVIDGRTLYREAARLLNVKVPTVSKVIEHLESQLR